MFIGLLSNDYYSTEWFLLTYNKYTGSFKKENITNTEVLSKLESSDYDKIFIRTTKVPIRKGAVAETMTFRDFIRGYYYARGISLESIDPEEFREAVGVVDKDLPYVKKCAVYIIKYLDRLEERELL